MKKTKTRKDYIKELDTVFSKFIRKRDSKKEMIICPLCGAKITIAQAQNMHFIKRSVMRYRRDEENCHAGCMRCNVILNGNYIMYTLRMIKKYGKDRVDNAIKESKKVYKISTAEIKEKIEYYNLQLKKE